MPPKKGDKKGKGKKKVAKKEKADNDGRDLEKDNELKLE